MGEHRSRRLILAALSTAPLLGCVSADPLAGKGSTASPALQKAATQVQTDAAAGLVASPQPATGAQVCAYDTPDGPVTVTIPDRDKCPATAPDKAR